MPVEEVTESRPRPIPSEAAETPGDHSGPTTNFFLTFMDRTSEERKAQVASFERIMRESRDDFKGSILLLRTDMRIFGVLMLLGILALAGVNVALNARSGQVNLTPSGQR